MNGRRNLFSFILVLMLASSLLGAGSSLAKPASSAAPAPIRLQAAVFNPGLGEAPSLAPGLVVAEYAQDVRGYYIVQFNGPVQQAWKQELESLGAELLGYIPDFAFKVRMNPAQASRAAALGSVSWVGIFQPAYKLSASLETGETALYRVLVERGADAGMAAAAIARGGAQVLSRSGSILLVAADAAQVEALANVLDVAWVENFRLPERHNEYGAGAIMGASLANASGYDGSTQIVAVADTGLGGGTPASAHPDLAGRVSAVFDLNGASDSCLNAIDDGAVDVDSGHGTHTALSVASDGSATGAGKGTAPAARLVFQAVEDWADFIGICQILYADGYYLIGIPADLHTLYQQAYNAGARVHSNSWGSDAAGDYTLDSANSDDFMWDNPDMLITFSAGNAGVDANANGVVDNDSIGSPATAKNVLTVGASENDRQGNWQCDTSLGYTACASQGGQNTIFTYGAAWPADYPANPLASDPSAGNAQQMAAFSSRGPTDDGRIKPDVVAPGTWVLSGYSDLYQQGYDGSANPRNGAWQYDGWGFPLNNTYKYMGGTSMSNPLTAGAAAVVKDYYQKAFGHSASAALTKATLINSAADLLDENNDGANDNDFPIPNTHEGWGLVQVDKATDGSGAYVDNSAGLGTGGSAVFVYNVTAGTPFKVTLVWTDFASTEAAAANLVNDLDLVVTAPGGTVYRGNVFSGGWSASGGSADRSNNVENVYLQAPVSGTYTVQVSGFNVPQGPQPFALVMDGILSSGPPPTATYTPTPTITPAPASEAHVESISVVAVKERGANYHAEATVLIANNNGAPVANASVSGSFSGDSTQSASGVTNSSGMVTLSSSTVKNGTNWTFCVDSVSAGGLTYNPAANVETCDSTGAPPTATPTPPPGNDPMHVGDLDGSASPVRNRWNAAVTIRVHAPLEAPLANVTVSGSWDDGSTASCVTDGSGSCTVTRNNVRSSSISFTVTGLSEAAHYYDPASNHDPDGDSNGTTITVPAP